MAGHPIAFDPDDTSPRQAALDRAVEAWFRSGTTSPGAIWQNVFEARTIADVEASIERQGLAQ